ASAGDRRQWNPRSFTRNRRFWEAAPRIRFGAPLTAVPRPAGHEDGIHAIAAHDLANAEAGDLGIAAPLSLAGHHEVEIELADQPHAAGARLVVDASERFVEQHQPRRVFVGTPIVTAGGGEQRDRQTERTLAARCGAGERPPLPVLVAFDREAMPAAIIQRPRQTVVQCAALVALPLVIDARLQKLADEPPVLDGPGFRTGVEQALARQPEAGHRVLVVLGQWVPDQSVAHAG